MEEIIQLTEKINKLDLTNPANLKIAVSLIREAEIILEKIKLGYIKSKTND